MKISRVILSILASGILFSCQPDQEELNQIKRAEVIAVHDEVMPKIGQLKKLEKEAEKKIEMLQMGETVDSLQIQDLKVLAFDLNQAYDAMFIWMRQYKTEDEEKTPEEIKVYLEDQALKINEVNEQIKAILSKSEEVLKD